MNQLVSLSCISLIHTALSIICSSLLLCQTLPLCFFLKASAESNRNRKTKFSSSQISCKKFATNTRDRGYWGSASTNTLLPCFRLLGHTLVLLHSTRTTRDSFLFDQQCALQLSSVSVALYTLCSSTTDRRCYSSWLVGGDPLHLRLVNRLYDDDLVHDDTHGSMAMATTTRRPRLAMMRALRCAQRDHNLLQKFLQSSTNRVPNTVPLSPGRGRCAKFPNPQGSTALDASRIAENSHRRTTVRLCRNCYLSTNAQSTSLYRTSTGQGH